MCPVVDPAGSPPSPPGAPRMRTIPLPEVDTLAVVTHPSVAGEQTPVEHSSFLLLHPPYTPDNAPIGQSLDPRDPTNGSIATPLRRPDLESGGPSDTASVRNPIDGNPFHRSHRSELDSEGQYFNPERATDLPITHPSDPLPPLYLEIDERSDIEGREPDSSSRSINVIDSEGIATDAEHHHNSAAISQPESRLLESQQGVNSRSCRCACDGLGSAIRAAISALLGRGVISNPSSP
jgi:hypothetical protein